MNDARFDASVVPLCVDMDGTLLRTDALIEGLVDKVRNFSNWASLVGLFFGNRAQLKSTVAETSNIDIPYLPLNSAFLEFLKTEHQRGRPLILVTAADERVAKAVAAHIGLFEAVIASDGNLNLKGPAKARRLIEELGAGKFSYAGNSRADLDVWKVAHSAVFVNVSESVKRQLPKRSNAPGCAGAAPN